MLVYNYKKYGLMCMNLTFDMFKLLGELSLIGDKEKLNNEFRHVIKLSKKHLQEMQMYLYVTKKLMVLKKY